MATTGRPLVPSTTIFSVCAPLAAKLFVKIRLRAEKRLA